MPTSSTVNDMEDVYIGTCGYQYFDADERYESVLQAYSDAVDVGELNRTFYSLPQEETAERWHREVVDDFTFTVKAWQSITHPWNSPTWNNHRDTVPEDRTEEVGYCRPTAFVRDAWDRTVTIARSLDAAVALVQTPPSFDCTDDHESNLYSLFESVDRSDMTVAWEPRGDWVENPERIARVCSDLDLVHVVDLLREEPVVDASIVYTRLHGLNEDRYDYDYEYTDEELDILADRLRAARDSYEAVYCLFNNFNKFTDAARTIERLR